MPTGRECLAKYARKTSGRVHLLARKERDRFSALNGNQGSYSNSDDHRPRLELPRHHVDDDGPSMVERVGIAMQTPAATIAELRSIVAPPPLRRQVAGSIITRRRPFWKDFILYGTVVSVWVVLVLQSIAWIIRLRSELSGTHGSWTRTDDVRAYSFLLTFTTLSPGLITYRRLYRQSQVETVPEGRLAEVIVYIKGADRRNPPVRELVDVEVRLYSEKSLFEYLTPQDVETIVRDFGVEKSMAGVRRNRCSAHPRARAARTRPYLHLQLQARHGGGEPVIFEEASLMREVGGSNRYTFGVAFDGDRIDYGPNECATERVPTPHPDIADLLDVMVLHDGPDDLNGNNGSATNTDDHPAIVLDWADQLTTMAEDYTPRYVTHPFGEVRCAFDVDSAGNVYYIEVEDDEWMTRNRQSCVALLRQQLLRLEILYSPRLDLVPDDTESKVDPDAESFSRVTTPDHPPDLNQPPSTLPALLDACVLNRTRSLERRRCEASSPDGSVLPTLSAYDAGERYIPPKDVEVRSQLNGSHGEYTNSDDVVAVAGGADADGVGTVITEPTPAQPAPPSPPADSPTMQNPMSKQKVLSRKVVDRHRPAPTGKTKNPNKQALAPPVGTAPYDPTTDPSGPVVEEVTRSIVPMCKRFERGLCRRRNCQYRHGNETGAEVEQGLDSLAQRLWFIEPGVRQAELLVYVDWCDVVYYHSTDPKTSDYGKLLPDQFYHADLGVVRRAVVGGDLFYCIKEKTIVEYQAKEWRYGTILLAEGDYQPKVAQWFAIETEIPSFTLGGHTHPRRQVWVHMHYLKNLRQYFTSARIEERQVQTSMAHLLQKFPLLSVTNLERARDDGRMVDFKQELLLGTIHYFWYTIQAVQSGMRVLKSGRIAPDMIPPMDENETLTRLWIRDYLGPAGEPWFIQPKDAPVLPYDVDPRTVFLFGPGTHPAGTTVVRETEVALLAKGVPLYYTNIVDGETVERRMPVFVTNGAKKCDWRVHAWFELRVYGEQPSILRNDTENMMVALKRICGKRDGHDELVANELALYLACLALDPQFRHAARAIDWPGVKRDVAGLRHTIAYAPVHQDVAIGMKRYRDRFCNRGAVRSLLDNVATVVHVGGLMMKQASIKADLFIRAGFAFRSTIDAGVEYHRRVGASLPHLKREERMRYVNGVKIHTTEKKETIVSHGTAKLKKEKMKYGKAGRLFITFNDGCIAGLDIPALAKVSIAGVRMMEFAGLTLILNTVLKPDKTLLRDNFRLMCEARGMHNTIAASNHGDDMIISGNVCGLAFTFNLDVNSCDTSHGRALFTMLQSVYQEFDEQTGLVLVEQCRRPTRVPNPADKLEYFDVYPSGVGEARLASGSPNTTLINSLATAAIAMAVASRFRRQSVQPGDKFIALESQDVDGMIRSAARAVGYAITLTDCSEDGDFFPERMEFLKHFYCPVTDQAVMCPSAYLRSLGQMIGRPHAARLGWTQEQFDQAEHHQRMHRCVSMVVNGLVHEPPNVLLDCLRARFNDREAPAVDRDFVPLKKSQKLVKQDQDSVMQRVHESILRRYNVSESELAELVDVLAGIQTGHSVPTVAFSKMMEVDYGIPYAEGQDVRTQHVAPPVGFRYVRSTFVGEEEVLLSDAETSDDDESEG